MAGTCSWLSWLVLLLCHYFAARVESQYIFREDPLGMCVIDSFQLPRKRLLPYRVVGFKAAVAGLDR